MEQAAQTRLLTRALELLSDGAMDMADATVRVPIERYVDPGWLEREERLLFRRNPVAVTLSALLREPGDYATRDLLGMPILVVRQADGSLRAFLNVCRHRGTRLLSEARGRVDRTLVCPYHAWSYDADGRLIGVPHARGFDGLDRQAHGLTALPVAEAFGVVFVLPSPGATLDLDAALGPLKAELEAYGLATHEVFDTREIPLQANWKLIVEGGLEIYHVRHTHRNTISAMFIDNVGLKDRFAPNARLYFVKRELRDLVDRPIDGLSDRDFGNPLYFLFPNLTVLIQPDHASMVLVYPQGVDRCLVYGATLIPEPAVTEKARRHWDRNVQLTWGALDEDFRMGESIQSGMRSGANRHVTFGRFEQACAWFEEEVDRALILK